MIKEKKKEIWESERERAKERERKREKEDAKEQASVCKRECEKNEARLKRDKSRNKHAHACARACARIYSSETKQEAMIWLKTTVQPNSIFHGLRITGRGTQYQDRIWVRT